MNYIPSINTRKIGFDSGGDHFEGKSPLFVEKLPTQNIVQKLIGRELFNGRRVGTEKYVQRSMYQSIYPNFTLACVDKPQGYLRKFTPDGKLLIAFCPDNVSIELYSFNGPQAAMHLFVQEPDERITEEKDGTETQEEQVKYTPFGMKLLKKKKEVKPCWDHVIFPSDTDKHSKRIRDNAFKSFFTFRRRIKVTETGQQLNRECSLFTGDSKYLILGSANYINDERRHPNVEDIYQNNESVETTLRYVLEDYTIHLIDLKQGLRVDHVEFPVDKIYLSHNQGVYLYDHTLAILSIQHQTIHVFQIIHGEFRPHRKIGRFCYEDDSLLTQMTQEATVNRPYKDKLLNSLKQRVLSFIHKQSLSNLVVENDPTKMNLFHRNFEKFQAMKIWRMQLLDEDHLLLRYSAKDAVLLKVNDVNLQYCIIVVYCISTTNVIAVYDNNSEELVNIFTENVDYFRNTLLTEETRYCSSPFNNLYAKIAHQEYRRILNSGKNGGPCLANKRILCQIPVSAQSFNPSPYFDLSLFSYDDTRISGIERPKPSSDYPLRFYERISGRFKFYMYTGTEEYEIPASGVHRRNSGSNKKLVAFSFHPTAPFAISVQRSNQDYTLNIHCRTDLLSAFDDLT